MRIAHVVTSARFAGVEQYVARLARAQAAAGHDVVVLGGTPSAMRSVAGPAVAVQRAASVSDTVRALRALPERPDVVNAHMTSSELAAMSLVPQVPVVATRHFPARRGSTPRRRRLLGAVPRLLAAQISVSRHVADAIGEQSVVVPSGVPHRPEQDRGDRQQVVVLGRLEPEKETRVALDAFAAAGLAQRGWTLSVAGSGSCMGALRRRAEVLGLDGVVRLHGHVEDPTPLLDRAAALIAPCSVEALGLAVLEAMSCGLPVVAAGAGGHLETVGAARPDLVFPPQDVTAAARLLTTVASDRSWAARAGSDLRAHQLQWFTMERQMAATAAIYESVTA